MVDWHIGTLRESKQTASDIKSLFFEIEGWQTHIAGQHCDFRLTAENNYQAERAYSIVSAPSEKIIEFGVQLLKYGEVSPYLWQMKLGDKIEIKGPLGGHFIWKPDMPVPLILIGGGSGIAPLLSIYNSAKDREVIFIESAKNTDKIMYYQELKDKLITRLTQNDGHIDQEFLKLHTAKMLSQMPMIYICGPTSFVETAATAMVNIGFNAHLIRTERFG